jgi:uncharacterized membrane protein/protein-disulfide isomerase
MQKTRIWLLLFGLIAFTASAASLYVHYRLIQDSSYTSFCDVSATVSCEAVYESAYGTVRGVPVAAGGVIWSVLVLLLAYYGMRRPLSEDAARVAEYVFLVSVVGLGAVLYLGYASYFILDKICLLCTATYVGVFGVFFVAAGATRMPFRTLPSRAFRDLRDLFQSPAAVTLALLWLVGSGSLVAFFPTETSTETTPAAHAAVEPEPDTSQAPSTPGQTAGPLPAAERSEFERWYTAQPKSPIVAAAGDAAVVIVKFNDYQCPPCRQTFMQYKSVLEKYKASHPGRVAFITRDFPLDPECNTGGGHELACEAAAGVRMARLKGRAEALEDWLFANQARMNLALLKQGIRDVGGVPDFDARYPTVLEQVRAEVKSGHALGVSRTPTFFINGRKIEGGLEPQFFDLAIEIELARAGIRPTERRGAETPKE